MAVEGLEMGKVCRENTLTKMPADAEVISSGH